MSENSETITSPYFRLLQYEYLNHLKGHKALIVHSQMELTDQPFVTQSLSLLEDIFPKQLF